MTHPDVRRVAGNPSPGRSIALWVPDWPLARLVERVPPGAHAVTVAGGRVRVATAGARSCGVRRGMALPQVRTLCPDVLVLPEERHEDGTAFERVLAAFDEVAPWVTALRPGLALAPAGAPARHHGGEERVAEILIDTVGERTGLECFVGAASGTLAPLVAAREGRIVPEGEQRDFLARVPLAGIGALLPEDAAASTAGVIALLADVGVLTCGDVVAMGRAPLGARCGRAGLLLHALCAGEDIDIATGRLTPDRLVHEYVLDEGAHGVEALLGPVRTLAETAVADLRLRGLEAHALTTRFETGAGVRGERAWRGVILLDAAALAQRLTWQIRAHAEDEDPSEDPYAAAITAIGVEIEAVPQRSGDRPLWGEDPCAPARHRVLQRIRAQHGDGAVRFPMAVGGMDPRSRIVLRDLPAPEEGTPSRRVTAREGAWRGRVPLHPATLLDTPRRVDLFRRHHDLSASGAGNGGGIFSPHPLVVDTRGRLVPEGRRLYLRVCAEEDGGAHSSALLPPPGCDSEVEVVAGPWPVRGRWWKEGEPPSEGPRAYLRVSLRASHPRLPDLLLVHAGGAWWVEGIHDEEEGAPAGGVLGSAPTAHHEEATWPSSTSATGR